MLVHRRSLLGNLLGIPQQFVHLYTRVERGNVRVKCLVKERNTISLVRPRTRTTRSGVESTNPGRICTNHWATAPNGDLVSCSNIVNYKIAQIRSSWKSTVTRLRLLCLLSEKKTDNDIVLRISLLMSSTPIKKLLSAFLCIFISWQFQSSQRHLGKVVTFYDLYLYQSTKVRHA